MNAFRSLDAHCAHLYDRAEMGDVEYIDAAERVCIHAAM